MPSLLSLVIWSWLCSCQKHICSVLFSPRASLAPYTCSYFLYSFPYISYITHDDHVASNSNTTTGVISFSFVFLQCLLQNLRTLAPVILTLHTHTWSTSLYMLLIAVVHCLQHKHLLPPPLLSPLLPLLLSH